MADLFHLDATFNISYFVLDEKEGRLMALHVVLYEPEIPANTGNVARTCLATNTSLHLIHPLGFSTDDKMLKRAGLDYWQHVDVHEYESIERLYEAYPDGQFFYVEDYGGQTYVDYDFSTIVDDLFLVFGRETSGIPLSILEGNESRCLRLPMSKKVRSLNLSNTVAIVLYETLRQLGYPNLT